MSPSPSSSSSAARRYFTSASGCSSLWPQGVRARVVAARATAVTSRGTASSSSSSSSSSSRDGDSDSALGFGGGASSRGGPSKREPLILDQDKGGVGGGGGEGGSNESAGHKNDAAAAASPGQQPPPLPRSTAPYLTISGSAGTGAIPGYGQRKRAQEVQDQSRTSVRERDDEIVRGYEHTYAPTSRSPRALPHHTYFSTPSTSFNAASQSGGEDRVLSASGSGQQLKAKKAALIFPGQGSQYVAMCRDIYRSFRSARSVWHLAEEALISPVNPLAGGAAGDEGRGRLDRHSSLGYIPGSGQERAVNEQQRRAFEEELTKSHGWDDKRDRRGRRGWLRDAVFFGDQLDLTRAENAQPSILVATLSILAVLRKEFSLDLIQSQAAFAAGHGSGTYAALVGSGSLDMIDAVRLLRHRGLISSQHVYNHPTLFPPGCTRPESMYETWAFANAGSGKGVELIGSGSDDTASSSAPPLYTNVSSTAHQQRRGWKRTQMSGVMVRPGMLNATLEAVAGVQSEIRSGLIRGVARDEVVEVANVNSSLQVVLSGTRVGVSVACDRLRAENLGARAVNLPVSGPYHSSLMEGAKLGPALANLPLRDPDPNLQLVSSVDGSILTTAEAIRRDLTGALAKPVRWLDSVNQLRQQGVERFICLGPGRACAHLLSKELGYRDKIDRARRRGNGDGQGTHDPRKEYEVWSLATVEDLETFAGLMAKVGSAGVGAESSVAR